MNSHRADVADHSCGGQNQNSHETNPQHVLNNESDISQSAQNLDIVQLPKQTFRERVFSWRTLTVILLHLSFVINMMPINTFSMALVCMCGPSSSSDTSQNSTKETETYNSTEFASADNGTNWQKKTHEFNWDSKTRGLLISAYLFTVFLVPQLSNIIRAYHGNKLTVTIFSLFLALLCFVSPVAARTNVYLLLAVRILTGLCTNANIPIAGDTLAWWTPVHEKLTCSTIITGGWVVAGIISPLLSGYLCLSTLDNGWPFVFYVNGIVIIVWTIAWYLLSSRRPEDHPFISDKEKDYIVCHRVGMSHATKPGDRLPYRTILTSRPVLAFLVSGVCHLWVIIIILNSIPFYMTSVLKFSLQDTGFVLSAMSAFRLPAMLLWSALGNWLLRQKFMTTNKVRKICFGVGQSLACFFSLGVSFLDDRQKWLASVLVILSVMSAAFGTTITSVVPLDMAPRYAGFITGLGASLSCFSSVTAPIYAATVAKKDSFEEWRIVWISMSVVNLAAGFIFVCFGNASLQPWALGTFQNQEKEPPAVKHSEQLQREDAVALNLLKNQEV